jgi:hypothetical protein
LQDSIGPRQFFEGWLHSEWELLQEKYYKEINSHRSAKRWTIAVIMWMWEIAWDIWEYRNEVLHNKNNHSTTEDTEAIDLRVKTLWDTIYITGLLPKDLHLADITLTRLLQFPRHQKTEWLHQVSLALEQAKSRQFHHRRHENAYIQRHQTMIASMQRFLSNWLHTV